MQVTSNTTKNKLSAFLVTLTLVMLVALAIPSAAAAGQGANSPVSLAQLAGKWQVTLVGEGSCGIGSELINFTLNQTGQATNVVWTYHTVSCGDDTITGQTFTVTGLLSDGNGTAQLDINGALQNFTIQVSPNAQVFNLVDLTDSGHYKAGTAVRQ